MDLEEGDVWDRPIEAHSVGAAPSKEEVMKRRGVVVRRGARVGFGKGQARQPSW